MNSFEYKSLVSIIIPVYNVEKYLKRCLDSVLAQTYTNIEVIAINDGSTDASGVILDEYAQKDERVKVIHKSNGGVSSARNCGLDAVSGDYVAMFDADDYVNVRFVEILLKTATEKNADVVCCGYAHTCDDNGAVVDTTKSIEFVEMDKVQMISSLFKNNPFTGSFWNKLIKREILNGEKFNEKIKHYEDYELLYKILKKSEKLVYFDLPLYYYFMREGSASHSKFGSSQTCITDVIDYMYFDVKQNFNKIEKVAFNERIRTYLMIANAVKSSNYKNKLYRKKLKSVVRKGLMRFLFGYSAIGYKIKAIRLAFGFWAY